MLHTNESEESLQFRSLKIEVSTYEQVKTKEKPESREKNNKKTGQWQS